MALYELDHVASAKLSSKLRARAKHGSCGPTCMSVSVSSRVYLCTAMCAHSRICPSLCKYVHTNQKLSHTNKQRMQEVPVALSTPGYPGFNPDRFDHWKYDSDLNQELLNGAYWKVIYSCCARCLYESVLCLCAFEYEFGPCMRVHLHLNICVYKYIYIYMYICTYTTLMS